MALDSNQVLQLGVIHIYNMCMTEKRGMISLKTWLLSGHSTHYFSFQVLDLLNIKGPADPYKSMYPQCPQTIHPPSTLLLCAAESSLCCSSYPDHQSKGLFDALSLFTPLYLAQQFMHFWKWLLNMCVKELMD